MSHFRLAPEIMTFSGRRIDLLSLNQNVYNILDIAHALSNICRFTGHTRSFYSVAQHSVLVSLLVPPEDALAGLLHDAAEAFLGDVTSPLNQLLPNYQAIERRIGKAILAHFGIDSKHFNPPKPNNCSCSAIWRSNPAASYTARVKRIFGSAHKRHIPKQHG